VTSLKEHSDPDSTPNDGEGAILLRQVHPTALIHLSLTNSVEVAPVVGTNVVLQLQE
jgi:hypothetical protein